METTFVFGAEATAAHIDDDGVAEIHFRSDTDAKIIALMPRDAFRALLQRMSNAERAGQLRTG